MGQILKNQIRFIENKKIKKTVLIPQHNYQLSTIKTVKTSDWLDAILDSDTCLIWLTVCCVICNLL